MNKTFFVKLFEIEFKNKLEINIQLKMIFFMSYKHRIAIKIFK